MLKHGVCGGGLRPGPVRSFDCSAFWAVFWEGQPTELSEYNLPGETGYYSLRAGVKDVRVVLRKDDFFSLSPRDVMVTDTAESVLTVKRCAVITRIQIYNRPGLTDPQTQRLFADLTSFIGGAARTKVSSMPREFEATLLFDP